MWYLWITIWIIASFYGNGNAQFSDNTPPVVLVERHWTVADTEPVGAVIVRVHAEDNEGDELEYGLEKPDGPSNFNIYMNNSLRDLPFRIDNQTGVVYTNDTLGDRGGESLFLYVTVYDGQLTHKSEVWVDIMNTTGLQDSRRPAPPRIPSNTGPQYYAPPPPPGSFRTPFHPLLPGFPSRPSFPPRPTPPKPSFTIPKDENTSSDSTITQAKESSTVASVITKLSPSKRPPVGHVPKEDLEEPSQKNNVIVVTTTPIDDDPAIIKNLAYTILPLLLVCVTFLISAISACMFRKRLTRCNSKKKQKKDVKDKQISSSTTSSGSTVSEEPMAMQHWMGPRANSNRYEPWDEGSLQTQSTVIEDLSIMKLDPWEFPRHRLKVHSILGEGCFGQVWKCDADSIAGREGTCTVAVKTLKKNAGERERTDLIQELHVMKMLEPHANVVRLLGCCTDKDPLFVIMEYAPHGKLQSFLRDSRAQRYYDNMHARSATLTSRDLTSFCYQVARGMEYLASKSIIHRDLAARNILLAENQICKVADFGFARDVMTNHVYERKSDGRLPIRWMAPESLHDNMYSVKSDVWAFGILIWEIVTLASTPYPGMGASEVMKKVREGYRMEKPEHCRRELYNIMYYCWDKDPFARPTFRELVTLLEQLLLSEMDYIELEKFPDHSYYNMTSLDGEKL